VRCGARIRGVRSACRSEVGQSRRLFSNKLRGRLDWLEDGVFGWTAVRGGGLTVESKLLIPTLLGLQVISVTAGSAVSCSFLFTLRFRLHVHVHPSLFGHAD
jgi:hypothetical protein